VIVVTVGTHEQQFDRLVGEVDRLARIGALPDEVFCQIGYETREPSVPHARMVPFGDLSQMIDEASLVITHGGPGSILPVLSAGRPLILVPRRHAFGEHVDNHQVQFCRRVGERRGVPVIEEIDDLGPAIAATFAGEVHATRQMEDPEGAHELALRVEAVLRGPQR
jgi:UDP-N-acetylglucosamine transferase subunit ALG13